MQSDRADFFFGGVIRVFERTSESRTLTPFLGLVTSDFVQELFRKPERQVDIDGSMLEVDAFEDGHLDQQLEDI